MTVQHVVLFAFPDPLPAAEAERMRAMISAWPEQIGGFARLRFGTDLNQGERARGNQYLLLTEHADLPALRAYQQHPVHLEFAAWVRDRGCQVTAFDYELDDGTCLVTESTGRTA